VSRLFNAPSPYDDEEMRRRLAVPGLMTQGQAPQFSGGPATGAPSLQRVGGLEFYLPEANDPATPPRPGAGWAAPQPAPTQGIAAGVDAIDNSGSLAAALRGSPTQPAPRASAEPPVMLSPPAAAPGNVRRIYNGSDVISVPMNADFSRVTGPQSINGQAFGGTMGDLNAFERQRWAGQGPAETGVPGTMGLGYYMDQLGRSGVGGSPALDQQRLQMAMGMQGEAARTAATVAAAHGRQATPQDRAQQFAEAAAASALQGGMDPGAAANQALRAREAFSDYQRRAGELGIAPTRPGQPAATPGAASPALQASTDADTLLNAIMPMSRDAKGVATGRGAFNAAGLASLPANLVDNAAAMSAFAQQAMAQLKPEDQVALQNSLAQELARSYMASGRTIPGSGNLQRPPIDLENGLARLTMERSLLGAVANSATGGLGYNTIRLPSQFGNRVIPFNSPSAVTRVFQNPAERDEQMRRYAAARAMLGSLAQSLSGR
jgi:hypothetical protein